MSNTLCLAVSYALNAIWEIPLVAGAGWIGARLARRLGARTEHAVWVATLMIGVVTPAVSNWPVFVNFAFTSTRHGRSFPVAIVADAPGSIAAASRILTMPVWLIELICVLYACSIAYFGAKLLWRLAATRALVRSSTPATLNLETNSLLATACEAFAVSNAAILHSSKVPGAVTSGARHPVIILPSKFEEQSTHHELLCALGHELAHISRSDYSKNLLYEIVSFLVAFHPAIWMIKARIVRTREMVCDSLVVERLLDAKTYRQSLLQLARRMVADASVNVQTLGIFDGNTLEERIIMMKTKKPVLSRTTRRGLLACMTMLLAAAVVMGAFFARQVSAQAGDKDGQWGTIYHPGDEVTNPKLTYAPDPEYPHSSHAPSGTNTVCVVAVTVDAKGSPQNVHIVRSAGKDFDANAIRAVKQYRFTPGEHSGRPVAVAIKIEVNFKKY
jgi:TonB family protein